MGPGRAHRNSEAVPPSPVGDLSIYLSDDIVPPRRVRELPQLPCHLRRRARTRAQRAPQLHRSPPPPPPPPPVGGHEVGETGTRSASGRRRKEAIDAPRPVVAPRPISRPQPGTRVVRALLDTWKWWTIKFSRWTTGIPSRHLLEELLP